MQYADYTYYTSAFGGSRLSQQEFASCCEKAQSYIDYLTLQKAQENLGAAVKNAVCAAAEAICAYSGRRGVLSENADGYSVSYEKMSELEFVYESVKIYLLPTGLLYCGISEEN